MRARTVFALGIAAIGALAVLWFARDADVTALRSVGPDAPAASRDREPEEPHGALPVADAARTALLPATEGAIGDGGLLVEVVFAADQQPAVDAAVFVLPPSVHEGAD